MGLPRSRQGIRGSTESMIVHDIMNEETFKSFCCFIPDQESMKRCPEDAVWEIRDGPTPDDFTHACSQHVGEMLQPDRVSTVYRL